MHQLQRIYFKLFAQQRPELDAYGQLVRGCEGTTCIEVRIFRNRRVLNIERRGKKTQAHIAQRDLPSQPLLKLRLNLPVILIHVDQVRQDKHRSDQQNDYDGDCDTKFSHYCLSERPLLGKRSLNFVQGFPTNIGSPLQCYGCKPLRNRQRR